MTQKAPERPVEPSDPERAEWPDVTREYVEYLEWVEDHALALVAAERESIASQCEGVSKELVEELSKAVFQAVANNIRSRTNDDAQAALDRLLQEARNEALREAAEAADKLGYHCIGCGHMCGDPEKDMRLLKKAGALSCCPERKMEPLSAAILALITEGQGDDG